MTLLVRNRHDKRYEEKVFEILPSSIPAKLLPYMTGIGESHGLHRSTLLAEAGVVVEEREYGSCVNCVRTSRVPHPL